MAAALSSFQQQSLRPRDLPPCFSIAEKYELSRSGDDAMLPQSFYRATAPVRSFDRTGASAGTVSRCRVQVVRLHVQMVGPACTPAECSLAFTSFGYVHLVDHYSTPRDCYNLVLHLGMKYCAHDCDCDAEVNGQAFLPIGIPCRLSQPCDAGKVVSRMTNKRLLVFSRQDLTSLTLSITVNI